MQPLCNCSVNPVIVLSMAGKARQMIADRFEKNFVQTSQIAFYEEILHGRAQ